MQQAVADMLERRLKRAIAIVLGVKEREADPHLPPETSRMLRKVILDQFNDFHEFVVDVIRSLDTGDVVVNEAYFEALAKQLDEVHKVVTQG